MTQDIRWIQRFNNFIDAFKEFEKAVHLSKQRDLSKLEKQGLIQSFEYTHELAWNVLKDYLEEQGVFNLIGSKDSSREAFKKGIITNGDVWMDMIKARNLTSHTYDEELAETVFLDIVEKFYPVFKDFCNRFTKLADKQNS